MKFSDNFIARFSQSKRFSLGFFLFFGVIIYVVIVSVFGLLYFKTNSVGNISTPNLVINYFDSLYFSFVSFLTIGYGDLYPINHCGKIILFVESIFSIVFNCLFSGGLIYLILRRPTNIILSNELNVKYKNGKYSLLQRIGNKGNMIVNCQISFEVYAWSNNIRNIIFIERYDFPIMECGVTLFTLDIDNHPDFFKQIYKSLIDDQIDFYSSLSFIGNDSSSGQPLSLKKYYSKKDIKFVRFLAKITSWKDGKPFRFNWKNFDSLSLMTDYEKGEFIKHFEQMFNA